MAKILVIDDDNDLRKDIVDFLTIEGYETLDARNGDEGILIAKSNQPDLILCDVMMPGKNGYEVLNALRSEHTTSLIPFVFLTARVTNQDQRYGMTLGADDYVTKPFDLDDLINTIETRLAKQQSMAETYNQRYEQLSQYIAFTLPHELRTPLVSILGFAEIIEAETTDTNIRKAAETIKRSGLRLNRLIENYLLYTQLELIADDTERITLLRRQRVEQPGDRITQIANEEASYANRTSDLHIKLHNQPIVMTDDNLQRITLELINNAFKFSEAGTAVEITSRIDTGVYHLHIRDYGRGMTQQEIDSVGAYKQFQRTTYEQQGTGMGLAIARRLTEIFGGQFNLINHGNGLEITLSFTIAS